MDTHETGGTLHRGSAERGFSLVELVSVIMVVGVLAAVAIPRFVGIDSFASRGFSDQAIGIVRYAQKTAIAWRTPIFVCVSATQVKAAAAAGCATPLTHPTTGGQLVTPSAPSGVTLTVLPAGDFTFDALGRPSASKTITVNSTIAGDPARQIVVEAETGYVHR
jgi:MSHA pilin protein MshC